MENKEKEIEELYARLDDLKRRANQGQVGISAFLSPKQLLFAEGYLKRSGAHFLSYGGYESSERKRIYVLPEYMEEVSTAEELNGFGFDAHICALSVSGSGFRMLTHRDFMGSLLGLGIQRTVVGDIVLVNSHSAIVFCDENIVDFLLMEWQKIANDKIKLEVVELPTDFCFQREYLTVTDTVASPRLDSVVAALCSLSREKAKEAVLSGLVELNYETAEHIDREVLQNSIVSVRGYGKFKIVSLCDKTKKGRYRLVGEKYL